MVRLVDIGITSDAELAHILQEIILPNAPELEPRDYKNLVDVYPQLIPSIAAIFPCDRWLDNGATTIVKYLVARNQDIKNEKWFRQFTYCCHLTTEIIEHFFGTPAQVVFSFNDGVGKVFCHCCERGDLELMQWLYATFDVIRANMNTYTIIILHSCCFNGHLDILKWLYDEKVLTSSLIKSNATCGARQFRKVFGDLSNADKIYTPLEITQPGGCYNFAFRCACARGYLAIAEWIYITFQLTIDEVKAMDNYAIYNAGNAKVFQWLNSTFYEN